MQEFAELYEFNEQLILNLKYGKMKLSEVTKNYKYVNGLLSGEIEIEGDGGEFIKSYAENLGTTDAQSQIEYLNERKQLLKKYKDESFDEYKKYGSLYLKISIMAGILVAVLLA